MQLAEIVGADQDHRGFRVNAESLAIFDPPEQMGGGVAFEAQVNGVAAGVIMLPDRGEIAPGLGAGELPILRVGGALKPPIDRAVA
jgi:hypothetical protein